LLDITPSNACITHSPSNCHWFNSRCMSKRSPMWVYRRGKRGHSRMPLYHPKSSIRQNVSRCVGWILPLFHKCRAPLFESMRIGRQVFRKRFDRFAPTGRAW
jgi:hypothetical protein